VKTAPASPPWARSSPGYSRRTRDNWSSGVPRLGAGADNDIDIGLNVGIARLADREDAAVAQTDVGLHDSPVIYNDDIGDDRIDGAARAGDLALSHAVADDLAAAKLHFLAISREVLLDLDEEFGVGEANLIAGRRTEHIGISGAGHFHGGASTSGWVRRASDGDAVAIVMDGKPHMLAHMHGAVLGEHKVELIALAKIPAPAQFDRQRDLAFAGEGHGTPIRKTIGHERLLTSVRKAVPKRLIRDKFIVCP
jgi:hypothetical protein